MHKSIKVVKNKKYEISVIYLSRNYVSPFLYGPKVPDLTKNFKVNPLLVLTCYVFDF